MSVLYNKYLYTINCYHDKITQNNKNMVLILNINKIIKNVN
jgi:hypothetical protein